MARILEFKPRWHAPEGPLSPEQKLEKLRKRTLDNVRDLVSYYNSTGRWNNSCEPHVIRAIEELYNVCNKLAGAEHAEPAPSIG